jgi:YD repeat-containing protein
MDDQGRLMEQKKYMYAGKDKKSASKNAPAQKPFHSSTVHYAYGKDGRLCETRTISFMGEQTSSRESYKYDIQGRLIAQRDYDYNDELIWEEKYRYISEIKVEVTGRMHKRLLIPPY